MKSIKVIFLLPVDLKLSYCVNKTSWSMKKEIVEQILLLLVVVVIKKVWNIVETEIFF